MPTQIKNVSLETLALPPPYSGMLPAGQSAIVGDAPAAAMAALGGLAATQYKLAFVSVPTSAGFTSHGQPNFDETIAVPTASCSLSTRVTRFDLAGASGPISGIMPDGSYIGQMKRFYAMSSFGSTAPSSATVAPKTMAEGRSNVKLNCLGAWAEMQWQSNGWKLIGVGGPTGPAVTIT